MPPSRLKVLWADLDAWRAREDHWDAVAAASVGVDGAPELWAAETVFEVVAGEDVLTMGYREHAGVLCISEEVQGSGSPGHRTFDLPRGRARFHR